MQVTKAEFSDGKLVLTVAPAEAMKWIYSFKEGNYDIVKHVEKRSRSANSYAWLLIGQLAAKMNIPPINVYRHAVENIGGKTDVITCRSNAVNDFKKAFIRDHLGRDVELLSDDGYTAELIITYGSSDYDNKQMSQLIDSLVQDCLNIGIETRDEGYILFLFNNIQNNARMECY